MEDMTNTTAYYELLGLEKGDQTTQEDIKRAWRRAALRLHPDRNPDGRAITACARLPAAAVHIHPRGVSGQNAERHC